VSDRAEKLVHKQSMTFRHLAFSAPALQPAVLEFDDGLNLFWGASNTGKSFALKSFDFMLGGQRLLPDIEESRGYSRVWLGVTIAEHGDFTICRAAAAGPYEIYEGLHLAEPEGVKPHRVAAKYDKDKESLSSFLLEKLGLESRVVAKDAWGTKQAVTLRALAHLLLVDETTIQAERSPVWGGQNAERTFENGVFRMLVTGYDDSALANVPPRGKTLAEKTPKLELLDQMIADIDGELEGQPDAGALHEQDAKLTAQLDVIEKEFSQLRASGQHLIEDKREVMETLAWAESRIDEIRVHADRFRQLDGVYMSDLQRLEALEEAGFLLSSFAEHECPLCGAPFAAQAIEMLPSDVSAVRKAAVVEMSKIAQMRSDLGQTVADLESELAAHLSEVPRLTERLRDVERSIDSQLPASGDYEAKFRGVIVARDGVRGLMGAHEQRARLVQRRAEVDAIKVSTNKDKPSIALSRTVAQDFANVVLEVLQAWGFPARTVSFDGTVYDVEIDGKPRINNGKGVRAVTHSAFKVALLIYCRERNLPHPGFLVLDTPLLTYRDPIKNPKFGALALDEKALAATPVRQKFFEHLHEISDLGQFVVFENVDPPTNVADLARVEVFSGQDEGRRGFFPPRPSDESLA